MHLERLIRHEAHPFVQNIEQFSYDADEAADRWWFEEGEAALQKISARIRPAA